MTSTRCIVLHPQGVPPPRSLRQREGLAHTTHTLTVRNTARRNDASRGAVLAIDAIHILEPSLQTVTPTPP